MDCPRVQAAHSHRLGLLVPLLVAARSVAVEMEVAMTDVKKLKRGFATMAPEVQRAIARRGGIATHAKGTGHEWTREEAIEAGRKGGKARKVRR